MKVLTFIAFLLHTITGNRRKASTAFLKPDNKPENTPHSD